MQFNWHQTNKSVEPYSQLAFIYDHLMRHVNYKHWAEYLNKLFLKADLPVNDVLDISCGTGNLLMKLSDLDYVVAGFDESENMLKIARKKTQKNGLTIPFWRGTMTNFGVKKSYNAIVCTYDSINYCLDINACESIFHQTSKALCSGGLFIFDICTEKNSRRNFLKYFEKETTDEFQYVRESYFLQRQKVQINEFQIIWNSDTTTVYNEKHRQRIYKIDEIKQKIPLEFFQIEGIYDGFTMHVGTEKSDRVHFVLKKI